MNSIRALFLVALLAITPTAKADDTSLYFDTLTKDKYILVVLRPNDKAEVLYRQTRPDGTVWLLYDDAATWGYFPDRPKTVRPNIWIKTKRFTFNYFLEEKRLTEIDKMGVQNILTEQQNTNLHTP